MACLSVRSLVGEPRVFYCLGCAVPLRYHMNVGPRASAKWGLRSVVIDGFAVVRSGIVCDSVLLLRVVSRARCGMEAAACALQMRRGGVTAELRGIATELRQARRATSTPCSGSSRRWRLSARAARVVWVFYSLVADPSGVLLHYLRGVRGFGDTSEWSDASLLELADRSFLEADFHEVVAVVDEDCPSDAKAMRVAKRLLAEWRLFTWCETQNVTSRIAPSTAALLSRAHIDCAAFPAAALGLNSSGRPAKAAREWARRWRKRWGARIGSVQACEHMSVEEMRRKVRSVFLFVRLGCEMRNC